MLGYFGIIGCVCFGRVQEPGVQGQSTHALVWPFLLAGSRGRPCGARANGAPAATHAGAAQRQGGQGGAGLQQSKTLRALKEHPILRLFFL